MNFMWTQNAVFYQIYPLGFCGCPKENDNVTTNRIRRVADWIDHLKKIGINAIYFSPVFEADSHGYDTRDYYKIDCRLGTNEDFADICRILHENGIRIVLDGVFHHVGRGFWAFQDVLKRREQSPYADWFYIDWNKNSGYHDGFWYEGWEGHYELVKLNLSNNKVIEHLFQAIRSWAEQFEIDGLRLDVAYCLDREFLKKLRQFCEGLKPEFLLLGEILFGDYRQLVNNEMLHSCTNYECYKGLYSSFNDQNLFEISYSLNRQFGPDPQAIYQGLSLFSFVDNHDVSRLSSIIKEERHIPLLYGLLFLMPGIPCIYYGSEWGAKGDKKNGDDVLRPCFDKPLYNELTEWIQKLCGLRSRFQAIRLGGYKNIRINNRQLVFEREYQNERLLVAINSDAAACYVPLDMEQITAEDVIGEGQISIHRGLALSPYSFQCYLLK
jgi:glycosidase